MKFVAVVLMAFVAMATGAPATDNELDEIQLPGLFGSLGGKLAAADDMYDYSSSSSSSSSSEEEGDELGDAPEDKACCFPNVWQGRLDSEFGFAPIGDGRHGDDDDSSDSDDGNDDKRRGGHGRPKGVRSIDMVYVDGSKKRLAGRKTEFRGPGKSMNVSYILLTGSNNTANLYLFNPTAKKCLHRVIRGAKWRQHCIPSNATMRGRYSLGPASGGLSVQSWTFAVGGGHKPKPNDGAVDMTNVVDDFWWSGLTTTRAPRTTTGRPRPRPRPRQFLAANVLVVPGKCTPVMIQESGSIMGGRRGPHDADDEFNVNDEQEVEEEEEDETEDSDVSNDDFIKYLFFGEPSKPTTVKPKPTTRHPRPGPHPGPHPRPGRRGLAFVGSVYFSGVKTSISDPSVFNVPSYCKKDSTSFFDDDAEYEGDVDEEIPEIVERFLML